MRTLTLCCNNARCPEVTEIGDDQFKIVDDDKQELLVDSQALQKIEQLGLKANAPDDIIKFKNVSMRADQAALAASILDL